MSRWYSYRPARKIAGGLRLRGEPASTWWGKRWLKALESFGWQTRLERGRRYARGGQVASVTVSSGGVTAAVQGSRAKPHKVRIELAAFSDSDWARVTRSLAGKALFAAKLLAGELPEGLEAAFKPLSLFPAKGGDLVTACSCPDPVNPCKHIAAVYYILAAEFDRDPFLLFKIRGLGRSALLESLRGRRPAGRRKVAVGVSLAGRLSDFYKAGEIPTAPPVDRDNLGQPGAVARELGTPPFWRGALDFSGTLERFYQAAQDRALAGRLAGGKK